MQFIPVRPPGVFTTSVDQELRDRWEYSRRFLLYAFVLIPALGVVSAAATTIGRGLQDGSEGLPEILAVACLAAVLTALVAGGGLLVLRANASSPGRSVLMHPRWWVWAAPVILLIQGAVMNRVAAAVGASSRGSWMSIQLLLPLVLMAGAGYFAWRAGRELTEPLHPALGDTGISVDIMREADRTAVMAPVVIKVTVAPERIVVEHKRGRESFGTVAELGFDRLVTVRSGWVSPGSVGDVWAGLPVSSADRFPPNTPAVVLRTRDRDIFLAVDDTALVAALVHRRALRYAAMNARR